MPRLNECTKDPSVEEAVVCRHVMALVAGRPRVERGAPRSPAAHPIDRLDISLGFWECPPASGKPWLRKHGQYPLCDHGIRAGTDLTSEVMLYFYKRQPSAGCDQISTSSRAAKFPTCGVALHRQSVFGYAEMRFVMLHAASLVEKHSGSDRYSRGDRKPTPHHRRHPRLGHLEVAVVRYRCLYRSYLGIGGK